MGGRHAEPAGTALPLSLPDAVSIREIGPRHAFQDAHEPIATSDKVRLVEVLGRTGVKRLEVTSFARPDVVPQLADAEDLLAAAAIADDVVVSALVLNDVGLRRAIAAAPHIDAIGFMVSASATHHRVSVGGWVSGSPSAIERAVGQARDAGLGAVATIATSFGCPYEGHVPPEGVVEIALELAHAGVTEVGFSDTAGVAAPRQVEELFTAAADALPAVELTARLRHTREQGMTNVLAALRAGCRSFDSSLAALTRSRSTTANVSTEDLVALLTQMGVATGVDPEAVRDAADDARRIVGPSVPRG